MLIINITCIGDALAVHENGRVQFLNSFFAFVSIQLAALFVSFCTPTNALTNGILGRVWISVFCAAVHFYLFVCVCV